MKGIDWIKGLGGLVLVAILGVLAVVFLLVFESLMMVAVAIVAIVAVLLIPYYFGRKNSPEKAGNYQLKKIK